MLLFYVRWHRKKESMTSSESSARAGTGFEKRCMKGLVRRIEECQSSDLNAVTGGYAGGSSTYLRTRWSASPR